MIKYAISDPSFFNPSKLDDFFRYQNVNFLLFRDKKTQCYSQVANIFIKNAQKFNFKAMLHQDYILAKRLNAFGVHLNSKQFIAIKRAKELGLFVVISTHSFDEIKKAQELGADMVTFSPIFNTPKKGTPKGLETLKKAVDSFNIKIIALGGIISKNEINQVKTTNAFGFASIRYFKD